MGLIVCKTCGSDVKILGKHGAYLLTECLNCGNSSHSQLKSYIEKTEQSQKRDVEVIRYTKRY